MVSAGKIAEHFLTLEKKEICTLCIMSQSCTYFKNENVLKNKHFKNMFAGLIFKMYF